MDLLTRSVIDEFVTNMWYASITPDQEALEELRILLNGVIAEIASRAKRVNLITLLSRYSCVHYMFVTAFFFCAFLIIVRRHTTSRPLCPFLYLSR